MAKETEDEAYSSSKRSNRVKMGLPHITSFCWCMGLEMGARLVALLHLAISLCLVVLCSVYAVQLGEQAGTAEDAGDRLYSTWYRVATALAVLSSGHVLLAFTLLYGVHKRNTCALRLWVWVMAVLLLAALGFNVVGCAVFGVSGSGSDMFLALLLAVLAFGGLSYCILCVHSYYLMLRSSEDMEGPSGTIY